MSFKFGHINTVTLFKDQQFLLTNNACV